MVNLGYEPTEKPIPGPDMSFVRKLGDGSVGWQLRGQYAIWTGSTEDGEARYRVLERLGNRVARIERQDLEPVFHRIAAGVPFLVETAAGCWLTFDTDAMWLDTTGSNGVQHVLLAVGGAAGKPDRVVVDWTCPKCGSGVGSRAFDHVFRSFKRFLKEANGWAAEVHDNAALRTCSDCGNVHPPVPGLMDSDVDDRPAPASGGGRK